MYTREEVQDLINNGSIDSQTKVWRADWNA